MTRDDIIRMAREAGGQGLATRDFIDIERFAIIVAAAEREECIKACDSVTLAGADDCIDAIRAMGEK